MYLTPTTYHVPYDVNGYFFGIWDDEASDLLDGTFAGTASRTTNEDSLYRQPRDATASPSTYMTWRMMTLVFGLILTLADLKMCWRTWGE